MPERHIDLLLLIIVSRSQSKKLIANLNRQHFYFTVIDSSSSLFQEPTVCLLMGLNHSRIDALNRLINKYCQPYRKFIPVQMRGIGELSQLPVIESIEGGATIYGMPVERFEQIGGKP
ncbi:MAG TPA: cyclic-di-AMP receptor [Brevefilum sp.]|nr:cyclic-di-AMP receptor [Brevefilum sp.]